MSEKGRRFGFGYSDVEKFAYIVFTALESDESAAVFSAANHTVEFGRDVFAKHSVHAADVGL